MNQTEEMNLSLTFIEAKPFDLADLDVRRWVLTLHFAGKPGYGDEESLRQRIRSLLSKVEVHHLKITPAIKISMTTLRVESVRMDPASDPPVLQAVILQPLDIKPSYTHYRLSLVGLDFIADGDEAIFSVAGEAAAEPTETPMISEAIVPPVDVNYLERDYEGFRKLMLDQLGTLLPNWNDRSPADVGVALVELLAYAADGLSYYQDGVATEAYLDTARKRISVRRHTRLLDYQLGEGCNARVWIQVNINQDVAEIPARTQLITRHPMINTPVVHPNSMNFIEAIGDGAQIFETMHAEKLYQDHNAIPIYTWEDPFFTLKKGATSVVLDQQTPKLLSGDLMLLEQSRSSQTQNPEDADPRLRHVVRLTEVKKLQLANGAGRTYVEWHVEDALPFDLAVGDGRITDLAVARGNIILADHGRSMDAINIPADEDGEPDRIPDHGVFRPTLPDPNLTFAAPYDHALMADQPAGYLLEPNPRYAVPRIMLEEFDPNRFPEGRTWRAVRDLLRSNSFDNHFTIECDNDRTTYIRFGDGRLGRRPNGGQHFKANYRIGNGAMGNVGADAVQAFVFPIEPKECPRQDKEHNCPITQCPAALPNFFTCMKSDWPYPEPSVIQSVRNPLPAEGGLDPETLDRAKLSAPFSYHRNKRCVTEQDYAEKVAQREDVQAAVARRRWCGDSYVTFIYVDRIGGKTIDLAFQKAIADYLDPFRMLGDRIQAASPEIVAVYVHLEVHVDRGFFANQIKKKLLAALGPHEYEEAGQRKRGFFHPDNFSFGQSIYLSEILGAALKLRGVVHAEAKGFHRQGSMHPAVTLREGKIQISDLEVVHLSMDRKRPELGLLEIDTRGGR